MTPTVHPFLMFEGNANDAIDFYLSIFSNAEIVERKLYGPGEAGPEGTVNRAIFSIAGQSIMCIDSFVKHDFTFTPSFSLFVDCQTEDEIRRLTTALSENGAVLMPLDSYGFSRLFTWVNDRFGVSWQLNLV